MHKTTDINSSSIQHIGRYSFYPDSQSTRWAVRYSYVADLNGDGSDEVIFAGFETQPNTPNQYDNTGLLIFGWDDGRLVNKNSLWLPNGIDRVQGVGDLRFGDFNGDGKKDFFTSSYTDMSHAAQSYVFLNQGDKFERIDLGTDMWQHGATVYDINKDGFDDVLTVGWSSPKIYMGGRHGLTPYDVGGSLFGAGIAVGDFLGDGSLSAVVTDWAAAQSAQDIALFKLHENLDGVRPGHRLEAEFVSLLPTPALESLSREITSNRSLSHDIRSLAMDFTADGLMDVIVFSASNWSTDVRARSSAVQFFANTGNGNFQDVTAQRLVGYDPNGTTTYTPVVRDFNGDGHTDIFSLDAHWETANSTRFLMGTENNVFVESGRQSLSSMIQSTAVGTVAKGPTGQFHLVWDGGSIGIADIYTSALTFSSPPAPVVSLPPLPDSSAVTIADNRLYIDASDGVFRLRDLRRAPAIQAQEEDLLDLTGLAQELDLDLWWSGNRAPGRKVDATGAVWERGNVIYVSTDRDQKAEWWARVVGVRDLDQDDFWLG